MSEYDVLGIRLSLILERLFLGETLSVAELAQEFNVSQRTIRRDFNQRLINLPNIELEAVQRGHYKLSQMHMGSIKSYRDILHFSNIIYIDRLFPKYAFDRKFIASLLSNKRHSPCVIYTEPPDEQPHLFSCFTIITQAIIENVLISFTSDRQTYINFAPYRLIYFKRKWFLVGEFEKSIAVIAYDSILNIEITKKNFSINNDIFGITNDEVFIQALPHFDYSISLYLQFKSN